MKPQTRLREALTPDGQPLTLWEHDGEYAIRVGGVELMSTRRHTSEERLATLTCRPLAERPKARALIGGLGLGFTLKAALATLRKDATVVVAELIPAVVEWNRDPALPLSAAALADRRVTVETRDVFDIIVAKEEAFDAILLDIDNGPAALTASKNAAGYRRTGLERIVDALRPGGNVGFWSADEAPAFANALSSVGLVVSSERCREHSTSGGWRTLVLGSRPQSPAPRRPRGRPGSGASR